MRQSAILTAVIALTWNCRATDVQVMWPAPTNSWPDKLWVYKVVPQEFSPAAISNFIEISGFQTKDRSKLPVDSGIKDSAALYFKNADLSKHLGIYPSLGLLDYNDRKAQSPSQLKPIVGVPNDAEALQLGLQYLRLVGIDRNDLAIKPNASELDVHWQRETLEYIDQTTKNDITVTNALGVIFNRRIDGIKVGGMGLWGGARVVFGNNAGIVNFQVCWRNLKPYKLETCPKQKDIANWILTKKITLHLLNSKAGYSSDDLKEVGISEAIPYYDGKYMDVPMERVYPYADCRAIVTDAHGTNAVWFQCPLTMDEGNWSIFK